LLERPWLNVGTDHEYLKEEFVIAAKTDGGEQPPEWRATR
jgi:hypothetical protein